ncbi:hypothetical protein J3R30DRAFT_889300 [Lentinula aciculospora]|uniref:Uncharacterized protein n=1 Tax=Lentinula aciculospora TaxID=153920 RepID=A0A9W9DV63_9AGAR|nr:hypothetical protein J3R30DRAFT_889300 [Lentinula aciculospora]
MSNAWSFNLRNHNFDSDSDDSDTDLENTSSTTAPTSDETKLVNDFDLSSREETVIYKPNPFSIAKINAASRAQKSAAFTSNSQPKPKTPLISKFGPANATIIDCFKNQSQKPQRVVSSTTISGLVNPSHSHLGAAGSDLSHPNLTTDKCQVAHIVDRIHPPSNVSGFQPFRRDSYSFSSPIKPPKPQPNIINSRSPSNRDPASSPVASSHRLRLHALPTHSTSAAHQIRIACNRPNALPTSLDQCRVAMLKLAPVYPDSLRLQSNIPTKVHDTRSPYSPLRSQLNPLTSRETPSLQSQITDQTLNSNHPGLRRPRYSPLSSPHARTLPLSPRDSVSHKKHRGMTLLRSPQNNLHLNPYKPLSPRNSASLKKHRGMTLMQSPQNNIRKRDPYKSPFTDADEGWRTLEPAKKRAKQSRQGAVSIFLVKTDYDLENTKSKSVRRRNSR